MDCIHGRRGAAQGSGLWGKGSGVFEYVVAMSLVVPEPPYEGYAKLVRLRQKDEDLKAAKISLGVLGAISRITFAVEKMFKRAVVRELRDDLHLEGKVVPFARGHEFADIIWYPSLHRVVYRKDDRVPVSVPGEGKNLQILFRPQTVQVIVQSRQTEEQIQATKDLKKLCQISSTGLNRTMQAGGGFLNDGRKFTGFPVVGYNNYMQSSSGCQTDPKTDRSRKTNTCMANANHWKANDIICGWDSRVNGSFFFHTSIAIPLFNIAGAIEDIKLLRDLNPKAALGKESSVHI